MRAPLTSRAFGLAEEPADGPGVSPGPSGRGHCALLGVEELLDRGGVDVGLRDDGRARAVVLRDTRLCPWSGTGRRATRPSVRSRTDPGRSSASMVPALSAWTCSGLGVELDELDLARLAGRLDGRGDAVPRDDVHREDAREVGVRRDQRRGLLRGLRLVVVVELRAQVLDVRVRLELLLEALLRAGRSC